MMCGELWPDELVDGRPVTCHLDKGHGGFWHSFWHEIHGLEGDGRISWHTPFARLLVRGLPRHQTVKVAWGHEVVVHPTHQMVRDNLPPKPVRR